MKPRFLALISAALWCCALTGCGDLSATQGSIGGGSPSVSFSPNSLTFGDAVEGTASQPLTVTLTNSGTATLTITSIRASANFAETNNCGPLLTPAANCVINVTLTPNTTGSVTGTVSFTDNAAGSPQIVSVSGTGTIGTTTDTLTGYCFGGGGADMCRSGQDLTQCPAGQTAISPQTVVGCLPPASALVDTSTACQFKLSGGETFRGSCVVQATAQGGVCSVGGQECGAEQLPPCCSGFICSAASDRAFCEPAMGGNASRAPSSWDQSMADRIR
jgi:hypothetical protein